MMNTTTYTAASLQDSAADRQTEQSAGVIPTDGERQSICEALTAISAFDLSLPGSSPDALQAAVDRVKDLPSSVFAIRLSLAFQRPACCSSWPITIGWRIQRKAGAALRYTS